jgi:hypothetical protein
MILEKLPPDLPPMADLEVLLLDAAFRASPDAVESALGACSQSMKLKWLSVPYTCASLGQLGLFKELSVLHVGDSLYRCVLAQRHGIVTFCHK